jgi:hypothetical protein
MVAILTSNLFYNFHLPTPKADLHFQSDFFFQGNSSRMMLHQLIEKLQLQLPMANDRRIACFAMLMCDRDPRLSFLESQSEFHTLLEEIQIKMQSIDDQHAAVASELDELAATQPCEFQPKHVWTLIRAIKVQCQFVDLLTGATADRLANS